MLQVNLSLRFSQKFTFAKLKPAAIKLIAVVASCACFISPATHPNVDNSQTWQRSAVVRSASVLSYDVPGFFVVPQGDEPAMTEVIVS